MLKKKNKDVIQIFSFIFIQILVKFISIQISDKKTNVTLVSTAFKLEILIDYY